MRHNILVLIVSITIALAVWMYSLPLQAAETAYPTAILSFSERGTDMKGQGANVRDLMFIGLVENPDILLVERADLDKILTEAQLNLSGAIAADQATRIGQLTGAKILITGSVFKIGPKTYLVAKIIGTETGKVFGKSVNGTEDLDVLAERLAKLVQKSLSQSASQLVAPPENDILKLNQLKARLKGKSLPSVIVDISEKHIAASVPDPAAETELIYVYKELGGTVLDKNQSSFTDARYRIIGQGFSEFSGRIRDLVSVKARLEIKVLDAAGKIIAVDKQTTVKVDLNEMLAGKAALEEAARHIAMRIIPKLVN